jgi:serine/threonine-protein kinase
VYESTHRNGRRAAIKVLSDEFAGNRRMRGRFQREGYLANRVGHPGAVEILDDDVSGDHAYLVMELLDGMTLDSLRVLRGGRLSAAEVVWAGCELLDVLQAAHARGILHRDVKPGNVFVTRAGKLKLLDFGIASLREGPDAPGITETGVALGTPGFMAPEQARGHTDKIGPATDVYAVGATMFRLLTGRLVHAGGTSSELRIAVATTDAPRLATIDSELPRELCRVVDRALEREPDKRFQSALAMKQALSETMARLALVPSPPALQESDRTTDGVGSASLAAPVTEIRRRRPWRGFIVGAAVTAVAAGVGYRAWRGATTAKPEPSVAPSAVSAPSVFRPQPPVSTAAKPDPAALENAAPNPPPVADESAGPKLVVPPARTAATRAAPPRPRPKAAPSTTAPAKPAATPPIELLKQRL